jgi:dienelactone hydrolase
MNIHPRTMSLAFTVALAAAPAGASRDGVHPLFDLATPSGGPFPSDVFTVPDADQATGIRVNLPLPDPALSTDFNTVDLLNQLDGFNVQPRLSIPFSDAIDPNSVASSNVFLVFVPTAPTGDGEDRARGARLIGINQIVWDVATNTLHVESDELLEQHARFLLVVTRNVRDARGDRVERSREFARFLEGESERRDGAGTPAAAYRAALEDALDRADDARLIHRSDVSVASLFTTMSVTSLVEKIHGQIRAAPAPAAATFNRPGAFTAREAVIAIDDIKAVKWSRLPKPPGQAQDLDITARVDQLRLPLCVDGAARSVACVGRIAFGRYPSPSYLGPDRAIPAVPTRSGVPRVTGVENVDFNLFLPAAAMPAAGWPVVIFGHGQGGNKNEHAFAVAAKMAQRGLATIAINLAFHGFGARSTLSITQPTGAVLTFEDRGRGIDLNGDGVGNVEGSAAGGTSSAVSNAHTRLQTSVDLMQLVRVIEVGLEIGGQRVVDPSRIYSLGFSGGSYVATAVAAVEPAVRATVLTGTLASVMLFRLDLTARGAGGVGSALAARTPSLINDDPPGTGLRSIGGAAVSGPFFNENIPFRDEPPRVNTVKGAMQLQEFFERFEWLTEVSAPQALAPHLRKAPLPGAPPRPVLLQFVRGDRGDVNPSVAAIVRAGDLQDRTTGFRHDSFVSAFPAEFIDNPHRFLVRIPCVNPNGTVCQGEIAVTAHVESIALAAQEQAAAFFASDGLVVIDPETGLPPELRVLDLFEAPFQGPIPEDLGPGGCFVFPVPVSPPPQCSPL